ncbi:pentapeptide repeat-containing protein [Kitasatospora herbaricolor]|uniref:Pentapeptide repeat-containing protein n=1 Tax=Kitasatospora herbaricolor TaxID=68217 RepID=A0ABZ1VZW9_9ACTN|nr:pentapeptide repeat-containing protein [Kitasatospora herbaricolor]
MTAAPATTPPAWPHCAQGASADDPVGCRGVRVSDGGPCLTHLPAARRAAHLAALTAGSDLDLRGTTVDEELLADLRDACRDRTRGGPRFGRADFTEAVFTGNAGFDSATFTGGARFVSALFTGHAGFDSATFTGHAWFDSAAFAGGARFNSARFTRGARFDSVTFAAGARFNSAAFTGHTSFDSATFTGEARFHSATFGADVHFDSATFEGLQHLGPMTCAGRIDYGGARFTGTQTTVEAAAAAVTCERAAFAGSLVLRLRYATLDLSRAAPAAPVALQAWPVPFTGQGGADLDEGLLAAGGDPPTVRLTSLDGVDAAHLVLTDIDLSHCRFTGAFHLDQIRIGFGCRFARPPAGRHRRGPLPARWSRRKVLAEEQHWRARAGGARARGWPAGPHHGVPGRGPGPADLAGVYQQLRRAFEEAGNEPDAADFYYGEMEMRRHDRRRPRAERRLLGAYWLASGYGLRASRALAWLLVAMAATLLLLVLFGLPDESPDPRSTGSYADGAVRLTTRTPDPVLTLPWEERITGARAGKAALVVVNSVVFRSSGQNLTLAGTAVEMASRIGEPVLLGLAALAVRGRVKR